MTVSLKNFIMRLFRRGWRFLFHWSAFSGLFITTSNCPCCGQPACPSGAAIMGALALIPATVIDLFRKRASHTVLSPHVQDAGDADPSVDHHRIG